MNYINDFFKTKMDISIKNLKEINNIFTHANFLTEKSIINSQYKFEMIEYNNKFNSKIILNNFKKITILNNISDLFDKFKNNIISIDIFSKEIIDYKNKINEINYLIIKYSNINLKKNINKNTNEYKTIYDNPIYIIDKYINLDKKYFINDVNRELYGDNYNHINILIDILLTGKIINISLPSIGLINTYVSDYIHPKPNTIIDYIYDIINNNNISEYIPFKSLNIDNTLTSILINNNNIEYNLSNEKVKLLIKDMINNIEIDINNIILIKNNSKSQKVKPEYIIPYKYDHTKESIVEFKLKSEYDNINDYDKLRKNNNEAMFFVIIKIFKEPKDRNEAIKRLNENKIYKNVLACFLFYVIRLFYDIMKEYINKLDEIITQLTDVKEKVFTILNIKDAFNYKNLLSSSLFKFKLILLNNFYYLFRPSKIGKDNYGMEKNQYNSFIPEKESIFLNNSEYIYINYPIKNCNIDDIKKIDIISNVFTDILKIDLINFITNIKSKNDIYNLDDILEFGGFCFNNNIMKKSFKKIDQYFILLYEYTNYTLFIIDKLIDYFINKQYIPYEIIDKELSSLEDVMLKRFLNNEERDKLKRQLLFKYNNNIEKSTNYYIKLIEIRNKIKNSKNIDINNLYNFEQIYILCFKIYYIKGSCIVSITENILNDIGFKNIILKEYLKIKKSYEKIISKHLK